MQAFTTHQGLVAPLDRENVDTGRLLVLWPRWRKRWGWKSSPKVLKRKCSKTS